MKTTARWRRTGNDEGTATPCAILFTAAPPTPASHWTSASPLPQFHIQIRFPFTQQQYLSQLLLNNPKQFNKLRQLSVLSPTRVFIWLWFESRQTVDFDMTDCYRRTLINTETIVNQWATNWTGAISAFVDSDRVRISRRICIAEWLTVETSRANNSRCYNLWRPGSLCGIAAWRNVLSFIGRDNDDILINVRRRCCESHARVSIGNCWTVLGQTTTTGAPEALPDHPRRWL